MRTRITKLLGIEYPVVQGGMAWLADANLAAAVSNGGGLGLIGSGSADADAVRMMIRRAKELTSRPFGVNIMMMSPHAQDIAQLLIDEKVAVVTTGAGNPGKYIEGWKAAGIKVIPVIPSVALARRMEKAGADAVVAEGCEAGGHIGELTTMALVPQVADAVEIPVIAAGGIADERGIAAAFMLGAQGVQLGTRFICCEECTAHENYKRMILDAKDTDTAVTGRNSGHPVRCLKNRLTKKLLELERSDASPEEFENMTIGSYRRALADGDVTEGTVMAGQSAGMVNEILPAAEIIKQLMFRTEEILGGARIG